MLTLMAVLLLLLRAMLLILMPTPKDSRYWRGC